MRTSLLTYAQPVLHYCRWNNPHQQHNRTTWTVKTIQLKYFPSAKSFFVERCATCFRVEAFVCPSATRRQLLSDVTGRGGRNIHNPHQKYIQFVERTDPKRAEHASKQRKKTTRKNILTSFCWHTTIYDVFQRDPTSIHAWAVWKRVNTRKKTWKIRKSITPVITCTSSPLDSTRHLHRRW